MWNKVRKYVWVVVVILAVVAIGSDIYRLVKQSKSHNEVSPTATPTVSSTPTLKPVHTPSPDPTPTHVPTPTPVLSPTVTPTGSPVGTEVTPTVTPTVTGVVMPTISITPNPREAEALESGLGPGVYYDPETGEFSTEERR